MLKFNKKSKIIMSKSSINNFIHYSTDGILYKASGSYRSGIFNWRRERHQISIFYIRFNTNLWLLVYKYLKENYPIINTIMCKTTIMGKFPFYLYNFVVPLGVKFSKLVKYVCFLSVNNFFTRNFAQIKKPQE